MSHVPDETSGEPQRPARRPRYKGTHPRSFEQRYKELDAGSFPDMQGHVRAQGRTPAGTHVPVLVEEMLAALRPKPGEVVVDCTVGYGGHAQEFLARIAPGGRLIGLDMDAEQIRRTQARLAGAAAEAGATPAGVAACPFSLHHSHFAGIGKVLAGEKLEGADIIFADLGVSSMQIDDPQRGFSYKFDGPLDMRMDTRLRHTAANLVGRLTVEELRSVLADYGDEPDAGQIAQAMVLRQGTLPLTRTGQLVDLVFQVKGLSRREWRERPADQKGQLHPAALTFQALRILVNDELSGLRQLLRVIPYCLRPGGRAGIISFHSGEDRIVAEAFAEGMLAGTYDNVAADAVRASGKEIAANPRSRSAAFRWACRAPE